MITTFCILTGIVLIVFFVGIEDSRWSNVKREKRDENNEISSLHPDLANALIHGEWAIF